MTGLEMAIEPHGGYRNRVETYPILLLCGIPLKDLLALDSVSPLASVWDGRKEHKRRSRQGLVSICS